MNLGPIGKLLAHDTQLMVPHLARMQDSLAAAAGRTMAAQGTQELSPGMIARTVAQMGYRGAMRTGTSAVQMGLGLANAGSRPAALRSLGRVAKTFGPGMALGAASHAAGGYAWDRMRGRHEGFGTVMKHAAMGAVEGILPHAMLRLGTRQLSGGAGQIMGQVGKSMGDGRTRQLFQAAQLFRDRF